MILFNVASLLDPKEIVGIVAGVLIIISFLMKGEIKIRAVNIIGATLFVVYGILISSISVVFLNAGLFIVQCIKLYQLRKEHLDEQSH